MDDIEVLRWYVERYETGQIVKCVEELSELTHALCRLFDWSAPGRMDVNAVVEEMADVEIMLDQMRLLLGVDPQREAECRARKLARMRERMGR